MDVIDDLNIPEVQPGIVPQRLEDRFLGRKSCRQMLERITFAPGISQFFRGVNPLQKHIPPALDGTIKLFDLDDIDPAASDHTPFQGFPVVVTKAFICRTARSKPRKMEKDTIA